MILRFHAAGLALLVAIAPTVSADDADAISEKETCLVITLSDNSDDAQATLRVPDGIDVQTVTSIAEAIKEFEASAIALMVLPEEDSSVVIAGGMQAAIRIARPQAEIYVTDRIPFAFVQLLSERVQQLKGIESVVLKTPRSNRSKRDARNHADPFSASLDADVFGRAQDSTASVNHSR